MPSDSAVDKEGGLVEKLARLFLAREHLVIELGAVEAAPNLAVPYGRRLRPIFH
jgi:hypothetical protein